MRFKEHIYSTKDKSNTKSKYVQHVFATNHTHGEIESTVYIISKGKHTNTIEKFYIYNLILKDQTLNAKHTVTKNPIVDTKFTQD
jgi:hypothetical protein